MRGEAGGRSSHRKSLRASIFAVAAAVALGGCHATVPGAARVATPNLDALEFGDARTSPVAVPPSDNDTDGRVLESVRMAEAVANPKSIDAALAYGGSALLPSSGRAAFVVPELALEPLVTNGMIAGYAVDGTDSGGATPEIGRAKILRLTVLHFRDDSVAQTAAAQLAAADNDRSPGAVALAVPGFDGAHSHWRPQVPVQLTTLAHGPFAVVVFAALPTPDAAALTALTAATLEAEVPLLDSFSPTASDKLSALPLDTDGMLRRLLHPSPAWSRPVAYYGTEPDHPTWFGFAHGSGVVYGPRGVRHLFGREPRTPDPKEKPETVEAAAFVRDWWLLRLDSAVSARQMHARVQASTKTANDVVSAPDGVPDSACYQTRDKSDARHDTRFFCYVIDGRYWALVSAPDEKTVRQRAAAQYALLVRSR